MASFWDEFKDLFKTQSQKDEERRQQIKDAVEAEKSLTEQLAALDKEYRESLPEEELPDLDKLFPEDSGLEKIEYTPATDKELSDRAQAEIDYARTEEKNDLMSKYDDAVKSLTEQSDKAGETMRESYKKLSDVYTDLKKQAENDALKRGIARSSIATSRQSDLDTARSQSEKEVKEVYDAEITAINGEIAALQNEQETAFEELDLKYAAELEDRIAELKEERDKTVEKYNKYNNSVAEKDREYAIQREKDIAEYLENREKERLEKEEEQREYESKYGYSGEKLENYSKRYDLALDFYTSLSPDIAAAALDASPSMRYYLGNYYDKLMSVLKNKESSSKVYF